MRTWAEKELEEIQDEINNIQYEIDNLRGDTDHLRFLRGQLDSLYERERKKEKEAMKEKRLRKLIREEVEDYMNT